MCVQHYFHLIITFNARAILSGFLSGWLFLLPIFQR
nr:MAG TPA: hypothetical protein [Caudoviricetes sp.]